MKTDTLFNQLKKFSQKFLLVSSCLLVLIFGWSGNSINIASAATLGNNLPLLAEFNNSGVGNQLEGIGKQVQGRTQQELGKTQSNFEDAAKKANRNAEETTEQLKRTTKENINKTQNALDNAGDQIQDTAGGVIDSIKDFFNQ